MLRPSPARPLRGALLVLVLSGAATTSCAREDTSGYIGVFESDVRREIPRIERATGLRFKTPPRLEERTRDEVRQFLEREMDEQMSPLELAAIQQTYALLGVIPDTLQLRPFMLELLTEQVAGYYDPKTRVLYVVNDLPADMRQVTIGHELVHALQHQYAPIDSLMALEGDNDRVVAFQAVVEGHATYNQLSAAAGADIGLRLPGGWDQMRELIRSQSSSMPKFAAAPAYIQEMLLFPYVSGMDFSRTVAITRPHDPPFSPFAGSTEQILHPEKYLTDAPDVPTRVTLPAPRAGSVVNEDNLGEFETRLFLYEHLRDLGTAARAAGGWDGDRFQLVKVAGGLHFAWVTIWDTPLDAGEFHDAMERLVTRRFKAGVPTIAGETRSWTARGRRLTLTATTVGERPAVLFEDAPAATRGTLLDPRRITLAQP